MPLPPEIVQMDKDELAAARCPECHMALSGECEKCGFFNPGGHAFCGQCGSKLPGQVSAAGLLKHAQMHFESEEKAKSVSDDAHRRWQMLVNRSSA